MARRRKVGERRINLMLAFNAQESVGRENDTLPKKLFKPLQGGKSDGVFLTPHSPNATATVMPQRRRESFSSTLILTG